MCICQESANSSEVVSPFGRVLVWDWYDGPISCAACCRICESTYVLEMVDWSEDHPTRAYAARPLPRSAFNRMVQLASAEESSHWPIWVPGSGGPAEDEGALYRTLTNEAGRAEAPVALVALDFTHHLLRAARPLDHWEREEALKTTLESGRLRPGRWLASLLRD